MFQKAHEISYHYKVVIIVFIFVVAIKLSLRIVNNFDYMGTIDVVLYLTLMLLVCFGLRDFSKKKKENQK